MSKAIAIVASILALLPASGAFAQSEACCFGGGVCIDVPPDLCIDVFQGQPQGPGTTCAAGGCIGACMVDGECSDGVNIAVCERMGGIFGGSGSTCATLIGACCVGLLECVAAPSEADCIAQGGFWFGIATDCANVEGCDGSLGACCTIDGCVDGVEEDDCNFGLGGSWQETAICAQIVCPPIGACCIAENGYCIDGTSPDDCESGQYGTGVWQGEGTTCIDTACPLFGFGACCLPDGECWDFVEESKCLFQLMGTYLGDNVDCVDVDCTPCPADIAGDDGAVTFGDLLFLLAAWTGSYEPCPPFRPADIDEDCSVGFNDLVLLLSSWGPCR